MNLASSISESLLTKTFLFSFFAAIGGAIVLRGLWMEFKSKKEDDELFKNVDEFRESKLKERSGEKWVMVGIVVEIVVAVVFAIIGVADKYKTDTSIARIDPANLPILSMNALVRLRVKGKDFPDLTEWDSIPLSTNWGSKNSVLTFCGNAPNNILTSMPNMVADDFGIGTGFPDSRQYFLNLRMESVSAAINLPMQTASSAFSNANFISLDVKFLPPQSEILDGYAFVVLNNSLVKSFRIYPQKDTRPPFPNKQQAEILSKFPPLKGFERLVITGPTDAVAGTTISTLEAGKFTSLTNGESVPVEMTYFPNDFVIVGTNVPSGKIDLNLWK